jgi:phage terminase large subunit
MSATAAAVDPFYRLAIYSDNPQAFASDLFDITLDPHQVLIMNALVAADCGHGPTGITVRSCHGAGKTLTDAMAVFWFMVIHPFSLVPTTAPTMHQVRNVLWAEIARLYERCKVKFLFELTLTRLVAKIAPSRWFSVGVSSNRPDRLEGFHSPHLLFIVDEAKGVSDAIFDAVDGALTQGGIRLYTSTPGSRVGKFYRSHFDTAVARHFAQIHVNAFDIPWRVSPDWVAMKRDEWGEDSGIFQAKVKGEFPQESEDVLIPIELLDQADLAFEEIELDRHGKEVGPAVKHGPHIALGLDVARYGFNESVLARSSSHRLDKMAWWSKQGIPETTGKAIQYRQDWGGDVIAVDDSGVGGGVTDLLRVRNEPYLPIQFGGASSDLDRYANLKAEMCFAFKRALEENARQWAAGKPGTFALLRDDRLKGQLSNLRVRPAMRRGVPMGVKMLDPDDPEVALADIPKGLKTSPDRAHAAIIAYWAATRAAQVAQGVMEQPEQDVVRTVQRGRHRIFRQ